MIDKELFSRHVRVIVQDAWGVQGTNTTLNSMIEYIIKRTIEEEVFPILEDLEATLEEIKDNQDASNDGRISLSNGNEKASGKGARGRPSKEARERSSVANG